MRRFGVEQFTGIMARENNRILQKKEGLNSLPSLIPDPGRCRNRPLYPFPVFSPPGCSFSERFPIRLKHPLSEPLCTVLHPRPYGPRAEQVPPSRILREQTAAQRKIHPVFIDAAVQPIHDDSLNTFILSAYHGKSRAERFQIGDSLRLTPGGADKQICRPVPSRRFFKGNHSGKVNPLPSLLLPGKRFKRLSFRPIPRDHKFHPRFIQPAEKGDELLQIFLLCQTSQRQQHCLFLSDSKTLPDPASLRQLDFLFSNQRPVYITEQNGQKIEHPIENTFEAALYRLGTSNLSVAYAMNGKTQYKFIQILDRFEIKDNFGTKKRTKRNYNVHLSKDLMNTLLTEYNLLELKDYRNLPNRKGYRKFYLNLAKMIYLIKYKIDQGQAPYFTVTVDQLAKEFDVTVKDNHDRKKKVTSILNGINKKLERTKFQYQYIKGKGEKWPYTVQFFFDQETLEYFDEKIKAILTSQYHDALKSCFLLNKKGIPVSRHYQYKDFFKLGTGEYYHEFTAWLYSEEDKEIKENIYRDIYIKVVGIRPEDLAVNLNP